MNKAELMLKIGEYYQRTGNSEAVGNELIRYLNRIEEKEYQRIHDKMIEIYPPSKLVGISEIRDICEQLSVNIRNATISERREIFIDCDVCNKHYVYIQGGGNNFNGSNTWELCPKCGFPAIESVTMKRYIERGGGKAWEAGYKRFREKYLREFRQKSGKDQAAGE